MDKTFGQVYPPLLMDFYKGLKDIGFDREDSILLTDSLLHLMFEHQKEISNEPRITCDTKSSLDIEELLKRIKDESKAH
jgi:hypothetical protein